MKKILIVLFLLSILFLCGCANFFTIDVTGVLVCENPNLSIDFDDYRSDVQGYMGEFVEEGVKTSVILKIGAGNSYLVKYDKAAAESKNFEALWKGDCYQIGSALLFKTTDGQQILLKPQKEE